MKKRDFYLNIEEDKIFFSSINFDDVAMTTEDPLLSTMFNALSLNPTVIDVSNLDYMPRVGDVWNGNDFIGEEGVVHKTQPRPEEANCSFSFCIDGGHSFYSIYFGDLNSNMIIAALQSNPTITFEDINV